MGFALSLVLFRAVSCSSCSSTSLSLGTVFVRCIVHNKNSSQINLFNSPKTVLWPHMFPDLTVVQQVFDTEFHLYTPAFFSDKEANAIFLHSSD